MQYVNILVMSTINVLNELGVETGDFIFNKEETVEQIDIGAIVGLAGGLRGTIVILLDDDAAISIASAMTGENLRTLNDVVKSTLCELANISAGAFVSNLHFKVEITPPTVVIGNDIKLEQYMNDCVDKIVIPLKSGHLKLSLGLKIKGGN